MFAIDDGLFGGIFEVGEGLRGEDSLVIVHPILAIRLNIIFLRQTSIQFENYINTESDYI